MSSYLKFMENFSEINKEGFNRILSKNDSPFIKYPFLKALEESNSVCEINGWKPSHLIELENKELKGFMPLYIKDNSQGEFVFDHSWSYALNRTGRKYYPKLLTAIPFTPCESRKIISEEKSGELIDFTKDYMDKSDIESWHILYPDKKLTNTLNSNGFIERSGYKFVWNNKGYKTFEDYLKVFRSRQRKNIKNERKKISDYGINFKVKDAKSLCEEDWEIFYKFYKNTYEQRLQRPYLNKKFFDLINANKEHLKPVIFFAHIDKEIIAGSLCYRDNECLYGRHWGTKYDIDSLHFECCYYQGIEYCIKNNLKKFDPGVQGEHKIRRGFEPTQTNSYHFILKEDFRNAIADFCNREKEEIKNYLDACKRYTPFNKEYKIE